MHIRSSGNFCNGCTQYFLINGERAQQQMRLATVATIGMDQKEGGGLLCPFCRELGRCLIQCGLGRGLIPYQVASSSVQPSRGQLRPIYYDVAWAEVYLRTKGDLDPSSLLATIDMGQKLGVTIFMV